MNKNLKNVFNYHLPVASEVLKSVFNASAFNVMLACERSELPRASRNIKSIFLNRMYHPGSSANELTLKAKDDCKSVLQLGRSMIEMLGVLAIIAVLSVGGIAGYSKAMGKFKHDKWLQQVETLIFNIKDTYKNEHQYGKYNENILPTLQSMNVVPQDMLDKNNMDLFGNRVSVSMRPAYNWTRLNLQFDMSPSQNAVQNCHDLLHLVPVYTNYIWVAAVCAGINCDAPWLYRICGKIAPKEYIPTDICREYNLTTVMNTCKICAKQYCRVVVLFDNNA